MEYMSSGSLLGLADMERRRGSRTGWDSLQNVVAFYGISVGMLILCRNQTIHRDLKPGDVLLNGKLEPKIVDFRVWKCGGEEQ
jgi:serine/threonine protein kinase